MKGRGIPLLPMNSPHVHVECCSQVLYNSLLTSLGASDMGCDRNAPPLSFQKNGGSPGSLWVFPAPIVPRPTVDLKMRHECNHSTVQKTGGGTLAREKGIKFWDFLLNILHIRCYLRIIVMSMVWTQVRFWIIKRER